MEMTVELARRSERWHFPGAAALQQEFARRPWEEDAAQLIVVAVEPKAHPRELLKHVARSLRGFDEAGALRLCLEEASLGVEALLEAILNVSPEVTGRRRLEVIANALDRPMAWILWCPDFSIEQMLRELFDNVRKIASNQSHFPLIVLLRPNCRSAIDLSVGFPRDALLRPGGEGELWHTYLHWRLAWLAGGRPTLAKAFDRHVSHGLERSDRILELRLTAVANTQWDATDDEDRNAMSSWVQSWPRVDPATTDSLLRLGLLWRPPHDPTRRPQLVPWAARAMLADPPQGSQAALRAWEICEPLSAAALSRCLHLERMLKGRCDADAGGLEDSDVKDSREPEKYRELHHRLSLVPTENPSRPLRLLDFVSMGHVVRLLRGTTNRELGTGLCDLRNALAHGHPPSFTILRNLLAIDGRFAL